MCSSQPDDDPSQHDVDHRRPHGARFDGSFGHDDDCDGEGHGGQTCHMHVREREIVRAKIDWPRDEEGGLYHRHVFWQDEILPRRIGYCDYTFANGDYCAKLPGHVIHDLAETPSS